MSSKLGQLLRDARAFKGGTLRDVEKHTKISNAYISQLESGAIEEPSPHKLKKLADYYEINYNDLMVAAGYLVEGNQRPSSTSAMLLASQELTDAEAAALTAFLSTLRKNGPSNFTTKKRLK